MAAARRGTDDDPDLCKWALGVIMKKSLAITCLVVGASVATPFVYADDYDDDDHDATLSTNDAHDMDRDDVDTTMDTEATEDMGDEDANFVEDSVITAKVKAKLAAENFTSLTKIDVDTDADGVVWLSGTAESQADIDRAVALTEETEGVISVKNNLTVDPS
jgi:hyperosmotically inducible protein